MTGPGRRPAAACLLAASVCALVFGWLVTYGSGRFLVAESYGSFHDALARSLLAGRVDVPEEAISGEAFVRDGRFYGYFGPAPALGRMAANALRPSMYGRWSRLSMLAGFLATLAAAAWLLRLACARAAAGEPSPGPGTCGGPAFLVAVGLGSTLLFLGSRAYVYHEVTIWAGALALLSVAGLLRFVETRSTPLVLVAGAAAFLAFHTRLAGGGTGAVAACGLLGLALALRWAGRRRPVAGWLPEAFGIAAGARDGLHALLLLGLVGLAGAAQLGLNLWRWGDARVTKPYRFYRQIEASPDRRAVLVEHAFSLRNLRFTVTESHLRPGLDFHATYPFVTLGDAGGTRLLRTVYPEASIDLVEPHASLLATAPALALAGLLGVVVLLGRRRSALRPFRIPLLGMAASYAVTLSFGSVSYRYLHDAFPAVVLAAAVGVATVASASRPALRRAGRGAFLLLVAWGVAVNLMVALHNQRRVVWGVDPLVRKRYDVSVAGLNQLLSGRVPPTVFRMKVRFPASPTGPEPLLTLGRTGAGDFFFARSAGDGTVAFGFDHWGAGGPVTGPVALDPSQRHAVDVELDAGGEEVRVTVDGKVVLAHRSAVHPWRADEVRAGRNPIGGTTTGPAFSGELELLP